VLDLFQKRLEQIGVRDCFTMSSSWCLIWPPAEVRTALSLLAVPASPGLLEVGSAFDLRRDP
jgi:hypothetical protein